MAFFDKIGEFASNVKDKTGDAIETQKLNSKIKAEKSVIDAQKLKLGDYIFLKYTQEGLELDDGALEFCHAIEASLDTISSLEAEIQAINAEKAVAAAPQQQSAPQSAVCGSCGAAITPGARFCASCGAAQEPPKPAGPAFCPGCGAALTEGVRFCGECGYKVS